LLIAGIEAFDKEAVKKYAKQSAEEALAQFGEFYTAITLMRRVRECK
jgi:hypothetical protein